MDKPNNVPVWVWVFVAFGVAALGCCGLWGAAVIGGVLPVLSPAKPLSTLPSTPSFLIPTPTTSEGMHTLTPTIPIGENSLPRGNWAVRAYRTDDEDVILVNGHVVGSAEANRPSDWININDYFRADSRNYVTFVNVNGGQGGSWGFALSQNGETVWGNEGGTQKENSIGYTQTIEISPDGEIKEILRENDNNEPLGGAWSARANGDNVAILLVNDVFVGAAGYYPASFGWNDITKFLHRGEDNKITVAVWNYGSEYSWDFAIRKGETIVWGVNDNGTGRIGEVFYKEVIIDGAGNIIKK